MALPKPNNRRYNLDEKKNTETKEKHDLKESNTKTKSKIRF